MNEYDVLSAAYAENMRRSLKRAINYWKEQRVIKDEELIEMIRDAATEQLPIAVMTVKEMRQFAQKVAMECALISAIPGMVPRDITRVIKERYGLDKN